jgi:hypothetical protein
MSKISTVTDKTIVILEDNVIWLNTIRLWCKSFGFKQVVHFNHTEDFLEYYNKNYENIHVCLVDYALEHNVTCIEIIKQIRYLNLNTLIFSISANYINDEDVIDTERMKKTLNAGANRAIFKNVDCLYDALKTHLLIKEAASFRERVRAKERNAFL